MKSWHEMTYDEQRRLLGLPNVRALLVRDRVVARVRRWAVLNPRRAALTMQSDYALAGGKDA